MVIVNSVVSLLRILARPCIVARMMALPANNSSFVGVFDGRWNSFFLGSPSLSGLDGRLRPIIFEVVHVDRNNVARVGLLQRTDMQLSDDKNCWVNANTYGSNTEMSAGNAELIKKIHTNTRGFPGQPPSIQVGSFSFALQSRLNCEPTL